jgi:propionyl-CoA carboxylase beta chain
VTHEEVSSEDLGGASAHATKSGVTHFTSPNDLTALQHVRKLMTYIPQNSQERMVDATSFVFDTGKLDRIKTIVPENPNQPYDIREVIDCVIDDESFMEVHEKFAPNIVCGFARMEGIAVGIVANQPAQMAGVLDIDSSRKGARFVRITSAGVRESHPHDVTITREAPNYSIK